MSSSNSKKQVVKLNIKSRRTRHQEWDDIHSSSSSDNDNNEGEGAISINAIHFEGADNDNNIDTTKPIRTKTDIHQSTTNKLAPRKTMTMLSRRTNDNNDNGEPSISISSHITSPTERVNKKLLKKAKKAKEKFRQEKSKKKHHHHHHHIQTSALAVQNMDARPSDEMLAVLATHLKHHEEILWCERRSPQRKIFLIKSRALICSCAMIIAIVLLAVQTDAFTGLLFAACTFLSIFLIIRAWGEIQLLNATFYAMTNIAAICGHISYNGICDSPLDGIDHRIRYSDIEEDHIIVLHDELWSQIGNKVAYYEIGEKDQSEIIPMGFDGIDNPIVVVNKLRELMGLTGIHRNKKDSHKKKKKKSKKKKNSSKKHKNIPQAHMAEV